MKYKKLNPVYGLLLELCMSTQADALSTNFIKRGFQSCTKNCTKDKIDCLNGDEKTVGSYAWCNACDYEGKTNRQDIQDALADCVPKRQEQAKKDAQAMARAYKNERTGNTSSNQKEPSYYYRYN